MRPKTSARTERCWSDGVAARYPSPLRYPGGKGRLGGFFGQLIQDNRLIGCDYLEPFAGGAGVALFLLRSELVRSVWLNDLDRSVYAFWYAVTKRNKSLLELLDETPITVSEWDRQKEVLRHKSTAPLLELGFATLFLNRTNRSGILRATMIGGREQKGEWKLDARFNKRIVRERLGEIGQFRNRIRVTCADAIDVLEEQANQESHPTLAYLDPPYFEQGSSLYLNRYAADDHKRLAKFIQEKLGCAWILTYDDVPEVRVLYGRRKVRTYSLDYSADSRRTGREIMLASGALKVPGIA